MINAERFFKKYNNIHTDDIGYRGLLLLARVSRFISIDIKGPGTLTRNTITIILPDDSAPYQKIEGVVTGSPKMARGLHIYGYPLKEEDHSIALDPYRLAALLGILARKKVGRKLILTVKQKI